MKSRELIFRIMSEYDKHPSNPERLIDTTIGNNHVDHRDRRFIFEIVYGIIRKMLYLDYVIDSYVSDERYKENDVLRRILRIGMYQLLFMDRVPDHAAVNETVNLAKENPQVSNNANVVNACMRRLIAAKKIVSLPDPQKDLILRLSIEFSHPKWIIERWMKNYGLLKTKKLLAFNNEKPAIHLRRKLRNYSRQQFEAEVKSICEPSCGYMNLYYKLKKSLLPENIRMIQAGMCNVQAPSSGWVIALLDVHKGEKLIDLCSAPGGKTALLAELTGDDGRVCAAEVKWPRLMNVVETIERMELNNVYPLLCDATHPPFAGVFDKVLLDAPCTATGVFNRHPEARWVRSEDDLKRIIEIQYQLLSSSASLVGKNGVIVYSTCSIEPEENEMQIERFLKEHPEFILEPAPEVIPRRYVDDHGFVKITPFDHQMDGMFGARLLKMKS
jgi:16S rRNA (cytosine967-C5)-methyltransferase